MDTLETRVHDLVLEGFDHRFGTPRQTLQPNPEWRKLRDVGTRLWLDTGDIDEAAKLFTTEFDALTTNNTLLNNEIQKGLYDGFVPQAASAIREVAPEISRKDLLLEISFVLNARHGLRLVDLFDAYVSVELHTDLAHDVERSVAYAKRYHAICPERFIVKIPMTPAGLIAARRVARAGITVNFTLGFSARQNHVAALFSNTAYVNVFMGRLGAFLVDHKLGSGDGVGERATLATQQDLLRLRAAGRTQSRLIGASMRKGPQVGMLAGLDVFTMPLKVASEYIKSPLAQVTNRVNDVPEVPLSDGVRMGDFGGSKLWEIPDEFRAATGRLLKASPESLTPNAIQDHFAEAGFADFLPRWSDADVQTILKDGKIPVYATWRDRLASGSIGLDALMNASALYSFVKDQQALDDRVASLI